MVRGTQRFSPNATHLDLLDSGEIGQLFEAIVHQTNTAVAVVGNRASLAVLHALFRVGEISSAFRP